jgi:hypothetical protein
MRQGKTTAAFFALAVFFRILYIFIYPPQGNDHEMIHTAVDNLLSGNGLSYAIADPKDLSTTLYQPITEWPPLVAYILSFAKAIVGSSDAADLLLMGIGMLFLLLVLHSIMKLLNLSHHTRIILWIIIAANPAPFGSLGISDLYSALFMLWGVLFCLRFVIAENIPTLQIMAASVFFFLPAAFRYQYYPLILLFPLILIGAGKLKKDLNLFRKGLLSLSIVFFLLCFQVAMLYQHSGTAAHLAEDKTGFYPENIIWFYPFLLKSIVNTGYIETKLLFMGKENLVPYLLLSLTVTMIVLGGMFLFLLKQIRSFKAGVQDISETIKMSRFILFTVAISVVFLLIALSLRYDAQVNQKGQFLFTYVSEGRYFVVSSILFLILLASLAQGFVYKLTFSWHVPVRKFALATVMLINLSMFSKFLYNSATNNLVDYKSKRMEQRLVLKKEIETLLLKYKLPVVAASENKDLIYFPNIKDYGIVKSFKELFQNGTHTSQPVQLILVTKKTLSENELSFVQLQGAKEILNNKSHRMFHVIVNSKEALAMLY